MKEPIYPIYKKQEEHHFYKQISEKKVIHVVFVDKAGTVVSEQHGTTLYSDYDKNMALINNLDHFPFGDLLPSTEEEFNEAIRKAYFELELYTYASVPA